MREVETQKRGSVDGQEKKCGSWCSLGFGALLGCRRADSSEELNALVGQRALESDGSNQSEHGLASLRNLTRASFDQQLQKCYALKYLLRAGLIDQQVLKELISDAGRLAVLMGIREAAFVEFSDQQTFIRFAETAHMINSMTGSRVMYFPVTDQHAVIYDEDRLRCVVLKDERLSSDELLAARIDEGLALLVSFAVSARDTIINDILKEQLPAEEIESAGRLLRRVIADGEPVPYQQESAIADLAFPSARPAVEVEEVIRSYLDSAVTFGHTLPRIWIFDECKAEQAEKKVQIARKLAREYHVEIRYVGSEEKARFLAAIEERAFVENEDFSKFLRESVFPNCVLGTQRNFIHAYLSGKIYSTADDDSFGYITTIRSGLYHNFIRLGRMNRFIAAASQAVEALMPSPGAGDLPKLTKTERSIFPSQTDALIAGAGLAQCSVMLLSGNTGQRSGRKVESSVIAPATDPVRHLLKLAGTEGMRADGNKAVLTEGGCGIDIDKFDAAELVRLPVDVFGVHGAVIGRVSSELAVQKFGETEGRRIDKVEAVPSQVAFVMSGLNLTSAGSANNDIDAFLEGRSQNRDGEHKVRRIVLESSGSISNRYELSTTTFTTVDNRSSAGLLLPGVLDSVELKDAVQQGDLTRSCFSASIALDHIRQQRPWLNETSARQQGSRIIKELVYQANKGRDFGERASLHQRVENFSVQIMTLVGMLWQDWKESDRKYQEVRDRLDRMGNREKQHRLRNKKKGKAGASGRKKPGSHQKDLAATARRLKERMAFVNSIVSGMEDELGLKIPTERQLIGLCRGQQNPESMFAQFGLVPINSNSAGSAFLKAKNNQMVLESYLVEHDIRSLKIKELAPIIHRAAQEILFESKDLVSLVCC